MASMTNSAFPDDAIRMRSYLIWEREGRPEGRHEEHWLQAAQELRAETPAKPRAKTARPARASTPVAGRRRQPSQRS
jgi:Protein of unknown function (DUF2934)